MGAYLSVVARAVSRLTLAAIALVTVVPSSPANGQEPTPDEQPPLPPAEVLHCVRPFAESIIPDLVAPDSFSVVLDLETGKARLFIPELPSATTCYVVFKNPSDSNPVVLEWHASGIVGPKEATDTAGFRSSGEYCYQLIVGNPTGRSNAVERCIDVPTSVAPTPTPVLTPSVVPTSPGLPGPVPSTTNTPAPPDTGNGGEAVGDVGDERFHVGVLIVVALVAAIGLVALGRVNRGP